MVSNDTVNTPGLSALSSSLPSSDSDSAFIIIAINRDDRDASDD